MKFKFLLALALLANTVFSQDYWVDTDIVTGKFGKDVDDGLALIMLLEDDRVNITGISLVGAVDYGEGVAKRILGYRAPNKNIALYKGAQTKEELGIENEATIAMANALRQKKQKIFALGPVTNVATVIKNHPELSSQIEGVIVCMGRQPDEHFVVGNSEKYLMDYNLEKDVDAMQVLLNSDIPLVLAGFPPSQYVQITREDVKRIDNEVNGNNWLAKQLREWLFCWKLALGANYFIPFDAITIGYYLHPEMFEVGEEVPVHLMMAPNDTDFKVKEGEEVEKAFLITSRLINSDKKVTYVYRPKDGYKEIVMHALIGK